MTTLDQTSQAKAVRMEQAEPWAIRHVGSHLRLWSVAIAGLAADLWTKNWAFAALQPEEARVLVKNLCSLQRSLNPGALFGLGAGYTPVFVGASVLALLFVLYLFAHSPVSRWSMHIALGLVLAGALGNLYDRTTQSAYVAYYRNSRVIGRLVGETSQTITIGDFPDGANPRVRPRPHDESLSGPQPVVRDFIKIEAKIGRFALWPWVFNIADALLVVGVAILLLSFWSDRHKPHPMRPSVPRAAA